MRGFQRIEPRRCCTCREWRRNRLRLCENARGRIASGFYDIVGSAFEADIAWLAIAGLTKLGMVADFLSEYSGQESGTNDPTASGQGSDD